MGKKKFRNKEINTQTHAKYETSNQNQNTELKDFFIANDKHIQIITFGIVAFIAFVIFSDFLLLEKVFFYKDIASDSLNSTYPTLIHASSYIKEFGIPSWSFNVGMGQNSFTFPFYDPLDIFLILFNESIIAKVYIYKVIIEILIGSYLFFKYISKIGLDKYTSLIATLIYSFSSFNIVSSGWSGIFSVDFITLPLIMLSIEYIRLNEKKALILPFVISYIVISRPFNLAPLTIFIIAYIFFSLLIQDSFKFKNLITLFLKTGTLSFIGIIVAAPFFLEHLQIMLESPRGSGENSLTSQLLSKPIFEIADKIEIGSSIYRFFSTDILGTGMEYKGWMNYLESPMFYISILTLIFLPHTFNNNKRKNLIIGGFILFWTLPLIFPYIRRSFSLFTGDYYRGISLYISSAFLITAIFGLDNIINGKKINVKLLFGWNIFLFFILIYPFFDDNSIKSKSIIFLISIFLIIYTYLIYRISKGNINAKYLLIIFLSIELSIFSYISINNRDLVSLHDLDLKIGYNDYSIDAINLINKNDSGFYRIDKRYSSSPAIHSSLNDGMVQGYFGTSSYNSFNQKYYIQYQKLMGLIPPNNESATRWAPGLSSRTLLEGLNSVKYVLTKSELDQMTKLLFDSIGKAGDVIILKNKYVLPIGFAYDKIYPKNQFVNLSNINKDYISLNAAVVNNEDIEKIKDLKLLNDNDTLPNSNLTLNMLDSAYKNLSTHIFKISSFKPTLIRGSIQLDKPSLVYFSIPYDKGWNILDKRGNKIEPFILSDGMMGVYLKEGLHELQFNFKLRMASIGIKLSLIGIAIYAFLVWWNRRNK